MFALSPFKLGKVDYFNKALSTCDQALALCPNHSAAHCLRGMVLSQKNDSAAALTACDHAVALRPNSCGAHLGRGYVLRRHKNFDEALAACDRAIELRDNCAEAHHWRSSVLLSQNRLSESLAACDRALEPGESPQVLHLCGFVLMHQIETSAARGYVAESKLALSRWLLLSLHWQNGRSIGGTPSRAAGGRQGGLRWTANELKGEQATQTVNLLPPLTAMCQLVESLDSVR